MKVTVGPVIGKVTVDTARILVECDRDGQVNARLVDDQGSAVGVTLALAAWAVQDARDYTVYEIDLRTGWITRAGEN